MHTLNEQLSIWDITFISTNDRRWTNDMNHSLGRTLLISSIALAITGCIGKTSSPIISTQVVSTSAPTEARTPKIAIEKAEKALEKAKKEHLGFYSPRHNKEAEDSLKNAKKRLKQLESGNDSFLDIFSTNTPQKAVDDADIAVIKVEAGIKYKALVKEHLAPALEQLDRLDKLKAKQHFFKDYKRSFKELRSIILDIESDDIKDAKEDQEPLLKEMKALEIKTVEYITLNETRLLINRLDKADGEYHVPTLHKEAKDSLKEAETYIRENPRNLTKVKEVGKKAYHAALHAVNVLDRVKSMSEDSHEKIILEFESLLAPIAKLLKEENYAFEDIAKQADIIKEAVSKQIPQTTSIDTQPTLADDNSEETIALTQEQESNAESAEPEKEQKSPSKESKGVAFAQLDESIEKIESDDDLEISLDDLNDLLEDFEDFENVEDE